MSTHQVSYPRAAKKSITEESGRPGTCRSNVGCEAMEEPCTKRIRPCGPEGSPAFLFHRNNFTSPSLVVQCSLPLMRSGLFILVISKIGVIPGPEPTGPAFGRPDDRLREGTWNPCFETRTSCAPQHEGLHPEERAQRASRRMDSELATSWRPGMTQRMRG